MTVLSALAYAAYDAVIGGRFFVPTLPFWALWTVAQRRSSHGVCGDAPF